jgi:hypothetical protein
MTEPDFEELVREQDEERHERKMHRLDVQYGRIEDYRPTQPKEEPDGQHEDHAG